MGTHIVTHLSICVTSGARSASVASNVREERCARARSKRLASVPSRDSFYHHPSMRPPLAGPRDPPSTTKCTARSTTLDELPIPPNIRSSASTFDQSQYPVPRTSGRSGDRQLGGKEVVHGSTGTRRIGPEDVGYRTNCKDE